MPTYRAPSWSWASVDGVTLASTWDKWTKPVADILDCKIEPKGKNIFGEVKSGWIKLRAPLVALILDERVDPEGTGQPYENNPKVRTHRGDPEGDHSRFDFHFSAITGREDALAIVESLKGVDMFALILAEHSRDEGGDSKHTYMSLIVRPAERDSSVIQQLGFMFFDAHFLSECSQLDHPEERAFVMLV